jgi:hypothetical protein
MMRVTVMAASEVIAELLPRVEIRNRQLADDRCMLERVPIFFRL